MKNISIRIRIVIGFTVAIIANVIACVVGIGLIAELKSIISQYETYVQKEMLDVSISSADKFWQENSGVLLFTLMLIGVGVAILFEVVLIYSVRTSIKELITVSKTIAEGDTTVEYKDLGQNEFGEIMSCFEEIGNNLKINAEAASQIASGNLTIDIHPHSSKDILGNALKQLVNDNNDVLSTIKRASLEVNTGAGQVAAASQSLAQGSTEQASAIEQVTASIDDIASKTRDNAEQANEANRLVHNASKDAKEGNKRMIEMKTAMKEINDSSEDISKIIKVIDDIAFQTNILALNAAVEAARAGSYGKGFAVVAEEVRNLASKSSQAATETAVMIEDSIKKVHVGSSLADETSASLANIVSQVEKIVDITDNIAEASNNQATALAQVDQAVMQVSQVVQTNSATSEECAAASEELSSQATNLLNTIDRFKLKQTSSYGSYTGAPDYSSQRPGFAGDDDSITLSTDLGKY